jgi:hypothetical protein
VPVPHRRRWRGLDEFWLLHGHALIHSTWPVTLHLRGDRITDLLEADIFIEPPHSRPNLTFATGSQEQLFSSWPAA